MQIQNTKRVDKGTIDIEREKVPKKGQLPKVDCLYEKDIDDDVSNITTSG